MLKFGDQAVSKLFYGDKEIKQLYFGSQLVFQNGLAYVPDMWAHMLPFAAQVERKQFSDPALPSDKSFTIDTKANNIGMDLAPGDRAHWRGMHFYRDGDIVRVEVDTDRSGKASMKLQGAVPADFAGKRVYVNFATRGSWYGFYGRLWINGAVKDKQDNSGAFKLSENIVTTGVISTTGHAIVQYGTAPTGVTATKHGRSLVDIPNPQSGAAIGFVPAAIHNGAILAAPVTVSGKLTVPADTKATVVAIAGGGGCNFSKPGEGQQGETGTVTLGAGNHPVTIGQPGTNGTITAISGTRGGNTKVGKLDLQGGAGAPAPSEAGPWNVVTFNRQLEDQLVVKTENLGRGGVCKMNIDADPQTGASTLRFSYEEPSGGIAIPIINWKPNPT